MIEMKFLYYKVLFMCFFTEQCLSEETQYADTELRKIFN